MKEATGEVSMTVVTIVLVGIILALGTWLFAGENAIGKQWIEKIFTDNTKIDPNHGTSIFGDQPELDGE